jgi:uncharacterized protein involved in exopolysaccharide biosynthesis
MEEYFNNKSIFSLINKWKIHIIVIALFAGIVGGAASYLITPLFKSTAILYPVNLAPFSDENETEQMLQILQSNDIKFNLIENLKLDKHYKIDKKEQLYKSNMFSKLSERISLSKTEYESVNISVLDQDPKMAVKIVNEIIKQYNKEVQSLHRYKYKELLDIKAVEISNKKIEIDSLEKRIDFLRSEYGLLDYGNQVKELTRSYYKLLQSNATKAKEAELILDNFKKYGGEYKALNQKIIDERNNLKIFKQKYEEVKTEYYKEITFSHIVENAYAADKKSKPIRWLIVMFSIVGAIVFSLIIISIIESINTSKK